MDIVLHVGMNKTASTTLQEEVFPRLDDLQALGFKHPGEDPNSPLSLAVKQMTPDEHTPGLLRERLQERSDGRPLLLSEERYTSTLWHDSWEKMARTADRLAAELPEARIVITLREPAALLLSSYAQYIREGGIRSWRKFVAESDLRNYDVASVARLYEERFSTVSVLRYEDMDDPAKFAGQLVEATASSVPVPVIATWLRRYHNIGMSPLFAYAEATVNRLTRTSRFNPSPLLPGLEQRSEPLRKKLRWANRKFDARSWRVNRRISRRRREAASSATGGFAYPPSLSN